MIGNESNPDLTEYKEDVDGDKDIDDDDDDDGGDGEEASDWTERSIVFLRLYYHSEILEPRGLLQLIESCFEDLGLCRIPAISLIPCRGLCFATEQVTDDSSRDNS